MYQKSLLFHIVRYFCLVLLIIWAGFPILFLFLSAVKHPSEIFLFPPAIFFKPSLINFSSLFKNYPQIIQGLGNSLLVVIFSSLLTAIISLPAGYALSRYKGKFIKGSAFFLLAIRMIPPIIVSLPLYPFFAKMGLNDTPWVLVLLYAAFEISMSSWLMRAFIDEIPVELEQAAAVDGASTTQILTRIILPLSRQGIMTSVIFVAIFAWKEFMFAFIFTGTSSRTAPIILSQLQDSIGGIQWGAIFAASALQLLPILIFIVALQGLLIKGLTLTGMKG